MPAGGNSSSAGEWNVRPSVIQPKESNLAKYWDPTETNQGTEIPSRTKLATVK